MRIAWRPGRTQPHDPRMLAVRPGTDRAESGAHHHAALPQGVRGPPAAHHCEAGVCQDLALSPCENSCPLRMNIPRFIQLYKENRLEEAFEAVILDNPLPASTGRVCQHPCDKRCRRQTLDEPVNMRDVHRQIADEIFSSERFDSIVKRIASRKLEPTGRKVAVAGAGPTGLTAAFYLALMGHEVTVFDEQGGSRRHVALRDSGIPAAEGDPAARNRADRTHGREVRIQHRSRIRPAAERTRGPLRRGVHLHRNLERTLAVPARNRVQGCSPRAAVAGGDVSQARSRRSAARWPLSAAATPPSTPRARHCAPART